MAGENIPAIATAASFDLSFFTTPSGLSLDPLSVQFVLSTIETATGLQVNETQALEGFVTCYAIPPRGPPIPFGGFFWSDLRNGAPMDIASYQCLV